MINVIEYKGQFYPKFQSEGFAAKFAFPFAKEVLHGVGYDIGCNRPEWAFPGAIQIDPAIQGCQYDAYNLPPGEVDYVHSSHCLEHLPDWVGALDYWQTVIKSGGVLFLYLPHPDQLYWRPYENRKHIHCLLPELIEHYLESRGWANIFVSERDLNHSFIAMAEKQ